MCLLIAQSRAKRSLAVRLLTGMWTDPSTGAVAMVFASLADQKCAFQRLPRHCCVRMRCADPVTTVAGQLVLLNSPAPDPRFAERPAQVPCCRYVCVCGVYDLWRSRSRLDSQLEVCSPRCVRAHVVSSR